MTKNNPEPDGISVRLRLRKDGLVYFGSGVAQLLRETARLGSLNRAAKMLNMPYSKALFIVRRAEESLGGLLLERTIGGVGGGGSKLTSHGQHVLSLFTQLEEEVMAYAAQLLTQRFPY